MSQTGEPGLPAWGQQPSASPPPDQYGQSPYGQSSYGQSQHGQSPYGQGGPQQPPGTMGRRLVARILDGLVVGVPVGLVVGVIAGLVAASASRSPTGQPSGAALGLLVLVYLVAALGSVLYEIVLTARGGTLGKKWMGLRVVRFDTGAAPGAASAVLRWLIPFAGSVVVFGGLLVYLSPLWDGSGLRRGWHDMVATTRVIDVR